MEPRQPVFASFSPLADSVYATGQHCHCPALLSSAYSAPGHLVNASEFICGIYIGIFTPLMHIEEFECI